MSRLDQVYDRLNPTMEDAIALADLGQAKSRPRGWVPPSDDVWVVQLRDEGCSPSRIARITKLARKRVEEILASAAPVATGQPHGDNTMSPDRLYFCAMKGVRLSPEEEARVIPWAKENGRPWPVQAMGRRRSKKTA